jgi:hypothetical protein
MPEHSKQNFPWLPGVVILATILTGVASLASAGSPIKESQALCLVAAALAFGLLSNALLRD